MTATTRQFISALLTLLMVISAPALAMVNIVDSQVGVEMTDCGSMMMAQAGNANSSSDIEANCALAPDMVCPNASGLSQCGVNVSFALLHGKSIGLTDTGSQPVLTSRTDLYQDPFLTSSTPPPEHHS
ncbi:hypothetical protein FE848_05280 [Marinobacter sp. 1-3A]|jgi:hypothetical protein|uniref:hypothetical protein n=1 Tax=Marinobacter sp. 1-3A TaxID=2582920 RepID=UPI0019077E38|nr:hypothetical protein [Marinobacter sp. 1-3A]MBK1872629.1 hypothetical protein [Marinobacter sp. 1-3A]